MAEDQSPLGGPLELPDSEPRKVSQKRTGIPRRLLKRVLIGLGVVVVVALVGFGAGKLFGNKKSTEATAPTDTKPTTTTPTVKTSDLPSVSGTKTFNSSSLGIELTYPVGWTTTEASGGVRIESPEFGYTTGIQGTIKGNFRVYIRKGARDVDSKYIGRGVAIKSSEKLAYTAPTSVQRKETNLSFFGLDNPDQFAYFLVAGNFNLNKGDSLGPNYGKESDTVIVTGGYSSKTLTDDFATNQVSADTFQQTNAYKQAIDILKSLKLQ
jgi:hypothetical protein